MKNTVYLLSLLCSMLHISCDEYRPDPIDPRLPKYSERGKNTVGAIANGTVALRAGENCGLFSNCEGNLQIDAYPNNVQDSVAVLLRLYDWELSYNDEIKFILTGVRIESLSDLDNLKGVYLVNGTSVKGYFGPCEAARGRLEIKFAGKASHTDIEVLAGTFSLYPDDARCGITSLEWGRFDFSMLSGRNFEVYQW